MSSNRFSLDASTRILDVGGTEFNWNLIDVKPNVFFCNLSAPKNRSDKIWLIADGRNLPFKDRALDITYSRSFIEYLGDLEAQLQFAAECRRVGKKYYIQTPNKYFPV